MSALLAHTHALTTVSLSTPLASCKAFKPYAPLSSVSSNFIEVHDPLVDEALHLVPVEEASAPVLLLPSLLRRGIRGFIFEELPLAERVDNGRRGGDVGRRGRGEEGDQGSGLGFGELLNARAVGNLETAEDLVDVGPANAVKDAGELVL
jgi:hypothetical protein